MMKSDGAHLSIASSLGRGHRLEHGFQELWEDGEDSFTGSAEQMDDEITNSETTSFLLTLQKLRNEPKDTIQSTTPVRTGP
jgi:hypothetical protein